MHDNTLLTFGGVAKALGNGVFEGPLVLFGSPEAKDLVGDFFTAETDFYEAFPVARPLLYSHGMDSTLKARRLGMKTAMKGSAELTVTDAGVWMRGQLDMADDYEKRIYGMIEAGKMGTSSGSASHLVEREKKAEGAYWVKSWPLVEGSLTPCPCEPRNFGKVLPLKALPTLLDPWGESGRSEEFNESAQRADLFRELTIASASRLLDRLHSVVYANLYRDDEPLADRMEAIRTSAEQFADVLTRACEALLSSGDVAAMKSGAALFKTLFMDRTVTLPANVKLSEEWDGALAALTAVISRSRDANELRVKDGRVLSAANRQRIKDALDILQQLWKDTEPRADGGLITKEFIRFNQMLAEANGVTLS